MSLSEKLEGVIWILGVPIASYLICSGMDSLSREMPYFESLQHPLSFTKAIAGVIYIKFLSEIEYNNPNNKKANKK